MGTMTPLRIQQENRTKKRTKEENDKIRQKIIELQGSKKDTNTILTKGASMKTTIKALLDSIMTADGGMLQGGLNRLAAQPLPPKVSYRLGRLANEARSAAREFNLFKKGLFERYGEFIKDNDGNDTEEMKIKAEHTEACTKEIEDYLSQEKELWYEPVNLSDLEGCRLTGNDMIVLESFVVDDTPPAQENKPKVRATM